MVKKEEGLARGLRLAGWEMPKSSAPQMERNHPGEQTTGAAKEVVSIQRGIFDISITVFMKKLHVPFLLEKEKGRGILLQRPDPYL